MPSVEHSRPVAAPLADVWEFVRDMDNWAPLVTGYQKHEKLSENESIWFLKGELGGLTRIAEFKAIISEWDEQGRVVFTLEGRNEPVTGSGEFFAVPVIPQEKVALQPLHSAERTRLWDRLIQSIARWIFKAVFSKDQHRAKAIISASNESEAETEIRFQLTLKAGGMAGPAMNMLIAPMLKPVAQDLADNIAEAIIARRSWR